MITSVSQSGTFQIIGLAVLLQSSQKIKINKTQFFQTIFKLLFKIFHEGKNPACCSSPFASVLNVIFSATPALLKCASLSLHPNCYFEEHTCNLGGFMPWWAHSLFSPHSSKQNTHKKC